MTSGWQVLIFDTGPLWELVLYSAVHKLRYSTLGGELRHLLSEPNYQRLGAFIARFQSRTTTPHVIAEMSARIRRTQKIGQANIWALLYEEFRSMGMDEGAMRLLEMQEAFVVKEGAVDASVLALGLRLADLKPRVITVDRPLVAECNKAGLNAIHLWQVLAEEPSF